MTQKIIPSNWVPTSKVNNQRVTVVVCNSAIDTDWDISCQGTDLNGDNVQANFVILDNLANTDSATIKYGPVQWLVAPFTRRTFALPNLTPQVEVLIASGIVTVTLTEANMLIPDEVNQLATSGGGGGVSEYNPCFDFRGPTPTADEIIFIHVWEEAVQFQNNFNGVQTGYANPGGVLPLADTDHIIYRNGVHIGDMTWHSAGGCTVTTVGGVSVTFAVGDTMTIIGPHVPEGNIANFCATFAGTSV